MLFCSQAYLVFFTLVFVVYWALPAQRLRVWLLLLASFYFYASWNKWLALLIGVSTTIDWFLAAAIDRSTSLRRRRLFLTVSIVGNVGLLCYFKYVNFFLDSLADGLNALGVSASFPVLSVLLPIGISFYTFEAINYIVDVYRGRARAERNLANFMLFITFFPHLVAGPIVRARDFLPQIQRPKRWDWLRMQLGVNYFLLGLFKKLVVADRMAAMADPVFANPELYGANALWLAAFAYALQVYCDFSGYSDMALGSAHMLGYKLVQNFNMPYISANISEFWRRWHISLSTWLRDYLFIPLGGNKKGEWTTCRNLLITMTLCGLWHGANWNYVLFGFIQGWLLIAHRLFRMTSGKMAWLHALLRTAPGRCACIVFTFVVFVLSLAVFRCPSLSAAGSYMTGLWQGQKGLSEPLHAFSLVMAYVLIYVGYFVGQSMPRRRWFEPGPAAFVGPAYGVALSAILLLASTSGQAFIYFQF